LQGGTQVFDAGFFARGFAIEFRKEKIFNFKELKIDEESSL
jgi:hypothetical protein